MAAFQLQLGRVEVWKSWTIRTFHPLPHAPSTGAALHLWSSVTCSQHFNPLPSPANTDRQHKRADAFLGSTGNRSGVMRRSGQQKQPPRVAFPSLVRHNTPFRNAGERKPFFIPIPAHEETGPDTEVVWDPSLPAGWYLTVPSNTACPTTGFPSHVKGIIFTGPVAANPWRCLFKGGYSLSFSIMCLSRLWSNGLEQLVQNDLKSCTSSSPGQVSFQDQSIW